MKYILILVLSLNLYAAEGVYRVESLSIKDNSELLPLYKMVKGATVLGIGESAHGSEGFLDARTKIVKGFVEDEGYRLILLEQGYVSADRVNDYLVSCENNTQNSFKLKKAMSGLYPTYNNKSVKKLIHWLCKFNSSARVPVRFHGIDQWEDPWTNREIIRKGITLTKKEKYKELFNLAEKNCFAWDISDWADVGGINSWIYAMQTWRLEVEKHRLCTGSLYNLKALLNKISNIDKDEAFKLKMALEVAYSYEVYRDLFTHNTSRVIEMRDELQAKLTVMWMNKYKNRHKALLLEHNIHISKKQSVVIPPRPNLQFRWTDVRSTGQNLVGHYGSSYKSIAISGHEVASSRDGVYPISFRPDSLDYVLSKLGKYMIVDTQADWIKSQMWWMHDEIYGLYLDPSVQYDAIFFVRESKAAVGN